MMVQSLLLDVPDAAIKAVLHHLDTHSYGSLRLVSRSVRKRVTEHVPHVTLRLCTSSSRDQLRHWCQATSQLQHITIIHIHIAGEVSAEVFDLTMQLLSQRTTKVTQLHLLAAASNKHSTNAHIWWPTAAVEAGLETLQPLQHLLASLQCLTIKGIAFQHLARDLEQLAAVTAATEGWPLELLWLDAHWGIHRLAVFAATSWSIFSAGLLHLTQAFPTLTQLQLRVPCDELDCASCSDRASDDHGSYCDTSEDAESNDGTDHGDDESDVWYVSERDILYNKELQLARVTCAASIVNAIMQLKQLEGLFVDDFPDIWRPRLLLQSYDGRVSACRSAVAAAATTDDTGLGKLILGPLQSIAAAATMLTTLDDTGCWLLQQHPELKLLRVWVPRGRIGMTWQQQQRRQPVFKTNSSSSHCTRAVLVNNMQQVGLVWCAPHWRYLRYRTESLAADVSSTGSRCSRRHYNSLSLDESFSYFMSHYSSRPVSSLIRHINLCVLRLDHDDLDGLQAADLLSDMQSLTVLEVKVTMSALATSRIDALPRAIAATAAASVQQLTHLVFRVCGLEQLLTDEFLLPLTAAAGGPGSRLKRLMISGDITASITAAETGAALSASITGRKSAVPVVSGSPTPHLADLNHNAGRAGTRWHQALPQFSSLSELVIHQDECIEELLDLPVNHLPASLKRLECSRLNIFSTAAGVAFDAFDAELVGSDLTADSALADVETEAAAGVGGPQLRQLALSCCQLTSPVILASEQLEQLIVINSNWSGGWTAAAEAWPDIKQLSWKDTGSSRQFSPWGGGRYEASPAETYQNTLVGATIGQHAQDLAVGFKCLTTLTIDKEILGPWLSQEVLQPVVQHLQYVKQLHLHGCSRSISAEGCIALQHWVQQQLPCTSVAIFQ